MYGRSRLRLTKGSLSPLSLRLRPFRTFSETPLVEFSDRPWICVCAGELTAAFAPKPGKMGNAELLSSVCLRRCREGMSEAMEIEERNQVGDAGQIDGDLYPVLSAALLRLPRVQKKSPPTIKTVTKAITGPTTSPTIECFRLTLGSMKMPRTRCKILTKAAEQPMSH